MCAVISTNPIFNVYPPLTVMEMILWFQIASNYRRIMIIIQSQPLIYADFIQCCFTVDWTLRNEFRWNFTVNTNIVIWENAFEMFVCRMAAILSLPQCIRQKTPYTINRFGHHRKSYSGTVPLTSSILNHTTNGTRVQSRHSWNPRAHFMLWILYVEWNYVGYSEISCCLTDQTDIDYKVPCY